MTCDILKFGLYLYNVRKKSRGFLNFSGVGWEWIIDATFEEFPDMSGKMSKLTCWNL